MTGELFVELLGKLMYRRCQFRPDEGWMRIVYLWCKKPLHLVVDGLPAHKKKCVKEYVASLKGRLQLHFLPGYAPELNPDELVE